MIVILEGSWMVIYPQNGYMWMPDLPGWNIMRDDSSLCAYLGNAGKCIKLVARGLAQVHAAYGQLSKMYIKP